MKAIRGCALMRWMWNLLKVSPLAIGLPLIIAAASIGPGDAASNLSKWAHWLGIQDPPAWLTAKAIDHEVIIGSIILAACYMAGLWGVPYWARRRTQTQVRAQDELVAGPGQLASASAPASSIPGSQPTIRADDVVMRILGLSSLPRANEPGSGAVFRACEDLREKALSGTLEVFGGLNWRTTRPADYDQMVRERIPAEYWKHHRINVIGILGDDHRGNTTNLKGDWSHDDYYGIWFDQDQIDALWAPTKGVGKAQVSDLPG